MNGINIEKVNVLKKNRAILKAKHTSLTTELERERNSVSSDDIGNIPELLMERSLIEKQITMITEEIKTLQKKQPIDKNAVAPGAHVSLKNHTHDLDVLLVESEQSHPQQGLISIESPIGKAILGKKIGEEVTVQLPRGEVEYKITSIN